MFYGAIIAELVVMFIHFLNTLEDTPKWIEMGYLWYNVIGCLLVILFGSIIQLTQNKNHKITLT